jgi:aryl-alcohol dehydrogenase-like predicted oxidoreductase
METRPFGSTGLRVSVLGFGAGQIGGDELSDAEAARLLAGALDLGITLIDTARSYGRAEERIGRLLAHRRRDFVLSTKGGYGVEGVGDWTYDAVARGIEEALGRLRTDVIDVFHLHSCPRETLERGDVVRALDDARHAGKIRVAAYSGENEALDFAVDAGAFGSVQCSVNLADQRALDGAIRRASERSESDKAVIGKRPLANAAWRFAERPRGDYAEVYWERLQTLLHGPLSRDWSTAWSDLALRFSAFAPGVSSVIVGTRSLEHLRANAAIVADGPLASKLAQELRDWFRGNDRDWVGQV